MKPEEWLVITGIACIISVIVIFGLLYRSGERKKHDTAYEDLKKQYNKLYDNHQVLCERLNNSIAYFKRKESEFAELTVANKLLETKNNDLREQLKQETERCRTLSNIEITAEFIEAKRLIYETDAPFIFISGGAGTGKSFFLNNLLDRSSGDIAFVAPTGLSARNIGGRTIHSFFGFSVAPPVCDQSAIPRHKYITEDYNFLRRLKILVIDEISMVRSDMLDLICAALQIARNSTENFGGVKIVAVGDMYQLSPVVKSKKHPELEKIFSASPENVAKWKFWESEFFFDAQCLKNIPIEYVEFTKQFRQAEDLIYANWLNKIRSGFCPEAVEYFNAAKGIADPYIPRIFNTKQPAIDYNQKMLNKIPEPPVVFHGIVSGTFSEYLESDLPAPKELRLKSGASVMFVKNSANWQNGTLGIVVSLTEENVTVKSMDDQREYVVTREQWNEYTKDEYGEYVCIGSYSQLPLVLAWAFNVHKMQGLTFEKIVYNPSGWNPPGICYVALSRTRSLSGLYLETPLTPDNIKQNGRIQKFYKKLKET